MNVEQVGKQVLDAAFHVHTVLGPGLLESVYEAAMVVELHKRGLRVDVQRAIPVFYEGQQLDVGFRSDLIVEGLVLIELKSVEAITPLFKKITNNYVRLIPLQLGFLINFNVAHLKEGITRVVNGIDGKPVWSRQTESHEETMEAKANETIVLRPSLPSPLRGTF